MTIHPLKTNTPIRTTNNKDVRVREYLTADEIDQLIAALRKKSRNSNRDACLVTMMFRHGLRVGEAVTLKWDQIDFKDSSLRVNRLKGSKDSVHPIPGHKILARFFLKMPHLK